MSSLHLEALKQQATALTDEERQELMRFLTSIDISTTNSAATHKNIGSKRQKHQLYLAWLKANREQYAGQYVALAGEQLVGQGKTLREAHQQAKRHGVTDPFLVRVSSEQEILPGGF